MAKVLRLLPLLVLGVVLAGGHLGLLRMVAWSSMLIERCSDQPLMLAISTTFDGAHPCRLCLALDQQDESNQTDSTHKPAVVAKLIKIVGLLSDSWSEPPCYVGVHCLPRPEADLGEGIALAPPVRPPPRS